MAWIPYNIRAASRNKDRDDGEYMPYKKKGGNKGQPTPFKSFKEFKKLK